MKKAVTNNNGSDIDLSDNGYDTFEEETLQKIDKIENNVTDLKRMYMQLTVQAKLLGDTIQMSLIKAEER